MCKEPNDVLLFYVWLEQQEKKCSRKVNEDWGEEDGDRRTKIAQER